MKSSQTGQNSTTAVAMRLAPEDLRPGLDVAILTEVVECPTWLWAGDCPGVRADEMVRLQHTPRNGGRPLRIKAVCLPFLLVVRTDGKHRTLDVRRVQLVKLEQDYAKLVRKGLRRKCTPRSSGDSLGG
jgi:hypothetical protein